MYLTSAITSAVAATAICLCLYFYVNNSVTVPTNFKQVWYKYFINFIEDFSVIFH